MSVIEVVHNRGEGTAVDPVREIRTYLTHDGEPLAESDHCEDLRRVTERIKSALYGGPWNIAPCDPAEVRRQFEKALAEVAALAGTVPQ